MAIAARRADTLVVRRVGRRSTRALTYCSEQTFGRLSRCAGVAVRVLGVDPGLTRCGLGVVEGAPGRRLHALEYDVVRTPATDDVAQRLLALERRQQEEP